MTAEKADAGAPRARGLLIPGLLALAVFAGLVSLGVWQVERKAWKENLIATIDARLAAAPTSLPPAADWPRLDPARDEYRRVVFAAELLNDNETFVYTSGSSLRPDVSGQGYWVFTPARAAGGIVMVNRGFVPEGRRDPATRGAGQIRGATEIVGVMRWPEKGGMFTPDNDLARNIWFVRDPAAMAAAKDIGAVAPFYVEQESPPPPGGLPKVGTLHPALPNNHLGYAITWFGLALVLAISFGFWVAARRRNDSIGAAR